MHEPDSPFSKKLRQNNQEGWRSFKSLQAATFATAMLLLVSTELFALLDWERSAMFWGCFAVLTVAGASSSYCWRRAAPGSFARAFSSKFALLCLLAAVLFLIGSLSLIRG